MRLQEFAPSPGFSSDSITFDTMVEIVSQRLGREYDVVHDDLKDLQPEGARSVTFVPKNKDLLGGSLLDLSDEYNESLEHQFQLIKFKKQSRRGRDSWFPASIGVKVDENTRVNALDIAQYITGTKNFQESLR